ncbi:hypothetical protein KP509_21G043500 [Ceratopteris richardii]|nr:hypothetical protein KP509_21G043500 [Ceratopteris richardii]KAH7315304.1 hypothetical protein KP509_21G043500 [Ceratopteris richardii]
MFYSRDRSNGWKSHNRKFADFESQSGSDDSRKTSKLQSVCYSSDRSNSWKFHNRKSPDFESQSGLEDSRKALKLQGDKVFSISEQDPSTFYRGLEAIASSLSLLTNTLGMALEEQRHKDGVKASNLMRKESLVSPLRQAKCPRYEDSERHVNGPTKLQTLSTLMDYKEFKAPQEMAMAMTTKAKLVLRELKHVKQDLLSTKDRCARLEEENRRLRETIDKGFREEDDLVRLQLEALLAEKARLTQENANYSRENQFLYEMAEFHHLKLRELAKSCGSPRLMDDELDFNGEDVAVDSVSIYPPDVIGPQSKDVIEECSE